MDHSAAKGTVMSARKVFVGGCLGCLGLGLVLAVLGFVFFALPNLGPGPDPEPVQRQAAVPMNVLAGGGREVPDLGAVEAPATPAEALPVEPGPATGEWTLDLDLAMGNFVLEPAPAGEGLSVEADYDEARFLFEHEIDEAERRVRIRFGNRGATRLWFGKNEAKNRVIIRLPREVPLRLTGDLKVGQTRAELGGLHMADINLDFGVGDHALRFSEPTTGSLGRVSLRNGVGELTVRELGNASPGRVSVNQDLGELLLDLSGAWRGDATVAARVSLGECVVRVPDTVGLDVRRANVSLGSVIRPDPDDGAELAADAPRLTLDLRGSLGELIVRQDG